MVKSNNLSVERLLTIASLFTENSVNGELNILIIHGADICNLLAETEKYPNFKYTFLKLGGFSLETDAGLNSALKNVIFKSCELKDHFVEAKQVYDVIILAHVFSWIDHDNQEALLKLSTSSLGDNGIIYLDHNAMPGWHAKNALRGMIRHYLQTVPAETDMIPAARAFLYHISQATAADSSSISDVRNVAAEVATLNDAELRAEYLESNNWPYYFYNVVAKFNNLDIAFLADYDLRYVIDRHVFENIPADVIAPRNQVETEQHLDFLSLNDFRRSLFCKPALIIPRDSWLNHTKLHKMLISVNAAIIDRSISIQNDNEEITARMSDEASIKVTEPIVKAALGILVDNYPAQLSFESLYRSALSWLNVEDTTGELKNVLSSNLLSMYVIIPNSYLKIGYHKHDVATYIRKHPRASIYSRHLISKGLEVINMMGEKVELTEQEKTLLSLLDGNVSMDTLTVLATAIYQEKPVNDHLIMALDKFLRASLLLNR